MNDPRERPEELMMRHATDSLSPDEKAVLDGLIQEYPTMAKELRQLETYSDVMNRYREQVFCPDTARLYDYAIMNEDPDGTVAKHIDVCPICRDEVAVYQSTGETESISSGALQAFQEITEPGTEPEKTPKNARWLDVVRDFVAFFVTRAVWFAGAVSVAVVVLVLFAPQNEPTYQLALSDVKWPPSAPVFMGGGQAAATNLNRVAVVIRLKDFKRPPDPNRVESLYQVLSPPASIANKVAVLDPSIVHNSLASMESIPTSAKKLTKLLRKNPSADRLVLLTLSDEPTCCSASAELFDTCDGKRTAQATLPQTDFDALKRNIRDLSYGLLQKSQ